MLTAITTALGGLAALAAVFAFGLSITRSARLRRREQFYRDARLARGRDASDQASAVVADLHRITVSEVVARELTSPWRLLWPWAVWLVVVYSSVDIGYRAAEHLAEPGRWRWSEASIAIVGDPLAIVTVPFVLLGFLPLLCQSQVHALVQRARIARDFYDGEPVASPLSLTAHEASIAAAGAVKGPTAAGGSDVWATLKRHALTTPPGLTCASVGFFVGLNIWTRRHPGEAVAALELLGPMPAFAVGALAFSLASILATVAWARGELAMHAMPASSLAGRRRL